MKDSTRSVVAAVLGIAGALLLLSGSFGMTGRVISSTSSDPNLSGSAIGCILLVLAFAAVKLRKE